MSLTLQKGKDKFRAFVSTNSDPDWLREKREQALALYETLPSPVPPSREPDFPSLNPNALSFPGIEEEKPVVSVENEKTQILSLEKALHQQEDKIRPYLGEIFKASKNKWAALNEALWRGGSFVYVPRNTDAGLVVLQHTFPENSPFLVPRVLVVAEPGSRITLLDSYQSQKPQPAFAAPVIEVVASENTDVCYAHLQAWGKETHHHAAMRITASQGARVTAISCMLGGRRTVNCAEVSLQGQGSEAQLLGLVLGNAEQVFEHYTLQEHVSRQTESNLLIKVALKEKAYSHFDGLIWIDKGAKKSNAYQQNRNLLLSKDAKAESTPRLEILDEDVRCTHGASIGAVDPDQLFYLETRGIPEKDAEALIVEGFFEQALHLVSFASLQKKLRLEVSKRLQW